MATEHNQSSSAEEILNLSIYTSEEMDSSKKFFFPYTLAMIICNCSEMLQGIDFGGFTKIKNPYEDIQFRWELQEIKNIPAAELFLIWFFNEAIKKYLSG